LLLVYNGNKEEHNKQSSVWFVTGLDKCTGLLDCCKVPHSGQDRN